MPVALTDELLDRALEQAPRMRIGLIGDLFLDRYFEIDPGRTEPSIETGLDAYQVVGVRNQPGALGTVMANLAAMGVGELWPVSMIGHDGLGFDLLRSVRMMPVLEQGIGQSDDRLTPTYIKPLVMEEGRVPRELNRLDVRSRRPLTAAEEQHVVDCIEQRFAQADGWVVLDQVAQHNEGVVNDRVRDFLKRESMAHPQIPVLIDSRSHLARFDFGYVKGNRAEFCSATGSDVEQAARDFASRTKLAAFVTCGGDGMWVTVPGGPGQRVPTIEVPEPIDIVGAGDSATAALVVGMIAGLRPLAAAEFANVVASITIQQCGTTGTAEPAQIVKRWREWSVG